MKFKRYLIALLLLLPLLICVEPVQALMLSVGGIPSSKMDGGGIRRIFTDAEGYMWYGNTNGLCRDDGYSIKLFHTGDAETINNINEDRRGRILVSTDRGAYILDKSNYRIEPLDPERLGRTPVNAMYVTSDGDIWVNRHGALSRYGSDLKRKADYPVHDRSGKPSFVSGFGESRSGDVFMTSFSRGVYKFDKRRGKFEMAYPISDDVPMGPIMRDRTRDWFWIYDFRGHLYRFTPGAVQTFVRSNVRPFGSPPQYYENLIDIAQDDSNGYIWGVSRRNLLVFKPEKDGSLTPVEHSSAKSYNGSIMTSLCPAPGAMHVGSLDRGTSVIYFTENYVRKYSLPNIKVRNGTYPMVTAAVPADRNGLWWIAQSRYGLMLYDIETDACSAHGDFPKLSHYRLRMAEQVSRSPLHGGVWVSQERSQGVFAIVNDGMRMECVDSVIIDHLVDPTVVVTRLHEDKRGHLWIGTSDGLFRYDLHQRDFAGNHPESGYVSGIAEAPDGRIYAITKTLGLVEVLDRRLEPLSENSGDQMLAASAISAAPDGNIWVGTNDGSVFEYNPENKEFTNHTTLNPRLRQGSIRNIVINTTGHGWIVTDSKVFEFSRRTDNVFIHECDKDLPLSRILSAAPTGESDGSLIVGGVGGMVKIRPNPTLDTRGSQARAFITDVFADEQSRISDLFTDSDGRRTIVFGPSDRNMEFQFSALDHRHASKIRYAYRMADMDTTWRLTEIGENKAYFSVLPKGRHKLEVRVVDEYGREGSEITRLTVVREPYWYETWWMICLYILLACGCAGAALWYYRRRLNKANEAIWSDSEEMVKMRSYLESPVTLPEEEFKKLDRMLLQKATRTVEDRIDDPDFGVNALCEAVNMSRSTLSRKLKSITGMTPLDFIRDVKMKHACNLLRSNNYTISQISDMLGFNDRRYFTASFRKIMGMAPREWQEKIQKEMEAGD